MPSKKNQLNLKVRSRDEVLFEGVVNTVSSINKKGKFDVLARHANFISLINEKIEVKKVGGEKREIIVDSGILHVSKNNIEIYVGVKQSLAETPDTLKTS